jgi:DNA-binding transcriptional regulator LsrR (DeoR family)
MTQHETRPDWREWRRRRAWALKQQGWKQQDIAEALGVTKGALALAGSKRCGAVLPQGAPAS